MKKGIIFALITAFISGLSIFYNKLVIIKGIDPLIFNIIKNGGAAILLSLLIITSPKRNKLSSISVAQWKKLILIGIIGGSIPFLLFFEGLRQVSAANANLIHKTLFLWVAFMAIPILGEKLNIKQIIGYLLIAWANIFIGGLSRFTGSMGEMMILGATILWSIENIIAKIALKDIDYKVVAWGRMFIGSIFLIILALIQNKLVLLTRLNPSLLMPVIGSVFFLTGYVYFWFKALKFAPATVVTSVLILATPITNILSTVFITHNLPHSQVVNLLFTGLGVTMIAILFSKSSPYEVEPRDDVQPL